MQSLIYDNEDEDFQFYVCVHEKKMANLRCACVCVKLNNLQLRMHQ